MTFAALLVIQKRDKGKVSSRANNVRPYRTNHKLSQLKRKNICPFRFFFCRSERKRKSYQKENADARFRALRSATDATVGSCRLPQKAGENFNIKVRRAPLVTVLFERGGNESREKRMRLIRAGFEFRMILNADIEIPVCQFHRFDKSAVG